MKVSTVSVLQVLLLFYSESFAQFTNYRVKDYITNATNHAQNNYSPNAAIYAITSIYELDSTGKAMVWLYWFYIPDVMESNDFSLTRKMMLIKQESL